MTSVSSASRGGWAFAPPAISQVESGEGIINSLTAGLIIHRVGQVNYGFADEARSFARDLQRHMNAQLSSDATTFVYEEALGTQGRMHWLVHMKTPGDYGRLLQMVDHDKTFQKIYQDDRLTERGSGNWERMFAQGSFRENVLVPQHGFALESADELEPGRFVPPGGHQIPREIEPRIDSGTAGAIVLRTIRAKYEWRDLARCFLYDWQGYVNKAAVGSVTSVLFEEIWGVQDTLYLILHLRSLDDYRTLCELEAKDAGLKELLRKPRVSIAGAPAGWGAMFQEASMTDRVLLPLRLAGS